LKKKILIVGGTGFIGTHLLTKLKKEKFDITILFSKNKKKINKSVKKIICDISNKKILSKKLKNKNFDYIINLAGYVDHKKKIKTLKTHFNGCKNLIDIFKKKKIIKFIQIGSSVEYGKIKAPQTEDKKTDEKKLNSAYGLAKLRSTNYLINLKKKFDFPFTVVRFFLVYGPGQLENRLVPHVIKNCLLNKKFKTSSGTQIRDFLYIDDAINALFLILNNKKSNSHILNICSNEPIKIKDVIELIVKKIKKGKPNYDEIKLRPDEPEQLYSSYSKAKKILQWKPKIKINQGLSKTIKYYEQYF